MECVISAHRPELGIGRVLERTDRLGDDYVHILWAYPQATSWNKGGDVISIDTDAAYNNWLNSIEENHVTPSLELYRFWAEYDSNIDWRLGPGHLSNLLEYAIDKIETLEAVRR